MNSAANTDPTLEADAIVYAERYALSTLTRRAATMNATARRSRGNTRRAAERARDLYTRAAEIKAAG